MENLFYNIFQQNDIINYKNQFILKKILSIITKTKVSEYL